MKKKISKNDELKTTDGKFDIDFYDNKGFINYTKLTGYALLLSSLSIATATHLYGLGILATTDSTFEFSMLEKWELHWEVIKEMLPWYGDNIKALFNKNENVDMNFYILNSIALLLSGFISTKLFRKVKFKASVQEKLSNLGFNQYYLLNFNKKKRTFTFRLKKGEKMNYKGFTSKDTIDDIKQMFNVGKLKTTRQKQKDIILEFLSETPALWAYYKKSKYDLEKMEEMIADGVNKKDFKIISTCKKSNYNKDLKENTSFFGVQDIEGKVLFARFPDTVGIIQQHTLVAGGSGSGKSFMTTNWIMQAFTPENYQHLDHVWVINMKEDSNDWNFLNPIDKATVGSGLDDAVNILKTAELKMLANNRWNSVFGKVSNTNFGQSILVIDEIHKFKIIADDRTQPKTVRLKAEKCLTIIDTIATQSRSANLFIVGILQKATLDNLSSTLRAQCANRILLKSDKISSQVVIDQEEQDKNQIDSTALTSGQFIYYDMQRNLMKMGFAVQAIKEFEPEKINNYKETTELIKGRKESNSLMALGEVVARLKAEQAEADENDDSFKARLNDYGDRHQEKRDYWAEAEKILNNTDKSNTEPEDEEETLDYGEDDINDMGYEKAIILEDTNEARAEAQKIVTDASMITRADEERKKDADVKFKKDLSDIFKKAHLKKIQKTKEESEEAINNDKLKELETKYSDENIDDETDNLMDEIEDKKLELENEKLAKLEKSLIENAPDREDMNKPFENDKVQELFDSL